MGRKLVNSDRGTARFVRIRDEKNWDLIDELTALDKYKSDFNKLINNALDYGLPKLYEAEFGIISEDEPPVLQEKKEDITDENFLKIIRLLKEVIINATVNKSLICSLFQVKSKELGQSATGEEFAKGYYQNTPNFIADYEIRELRKLRD